MNRRRPPPSERRTGADRRKADKGPPGGRERRVGMEPRKPDVHEIEMTPSEWASLTADTTPSPAPVMPNKAADKPGKA